MEKFAADLTEQWIDLARDMRDACYEMTFFAMWNNPWARAFGAPESVRRTRKTVEELRALRWFSRCSPTWTRAASSRR